MSPVSGYSSLSNRAGSSMPGPALENQDKSIGGATRRPPERRIFDIMSEVWQVQGWDSQRGLVDPSVFELRTQKKQDAARQP
jgi:hypothetical protein